LINPQISSFVEIHPVGANLFHTNIETDGTTDLAKLIAAFRNFAIAPKIYTFCLYVFCTVLKIAIISLHSIKLLVFTTQTKCVYFAIWS